jgi:hypothetical protein
MSLSVNGSNTKHPYAHPQPLVPQGSSQSSSTAQSDPLSALLTALGQQGADATSSAAGATSSTAAGTSTTAGVPTASGSSTPQFGPQTLQALLALQTSENGGAAGGANAANSNLMAQLNQIQSQYLDPTTTQTLATV